MTNDQARCSASAIGTWALVIADWSLVIAPGHSLVIAFIGHWSFNWDLESFQASTRSSGRNEHFSRSNSARTSRHLLRFGAGRYHLRGPCVHLAGGAPNARGPGPYGHANGDGVFRIRLGLCAL